MRASRSTTEGRDPDLLYGCPICEFEFLLNNQGAQGHPGGFSGITCIRSFKTGSVMFVCEIPGDQTGHLYPTIVGVESNTSKDRRVFKERTLAMGRWLHEHLLEKKCKGFG